MASCLTAPLLLLFFILCSFAPTSTASAFISLEICNFTASDVVPNTNITWGWLHNQTTYTFPSTSYLRPDAGGALFPWVYMVVVIIAHLPVVIVRVVRWHKVQTWCIAATVLQLAVTIQAYKSTQFSPAQILTWTPLMLVVDAGSMVQIVFLIVEEKTLLPRIQNELMELREWLGRLKLTILHVLSSKKPGVYQKQDIEQRLELNQSSTHYQTPRETQDEQSLFKDENFYIALSAILLLIAVYTCQIFGLIHAAQAMNAGPPLVPFASPIFNPLGLVVIGADCTIYPINQIYAMGVGLIHIPGSRQLSWLQGTVAGISLALVAQITDFIFLASVHGNTRLRGAKMKRPWCSMIGGLVILGIFLMYGINYANNLPPEFTSNIHIVEAAPTPYLWSAQLTAGGLRGEILGFTDGLFSRWNSTYYGSPTPVDS